MKIRTLAVQSTAEIPEKNPFYRLAKRLFFNDFGTYDGHDHSKSAAPGIGRLVTFPQVFACPIRTPRYRPARWSPNLRSKLCVLVCYWPLP